MDILKQYSNMNGYDYSELLADFINSSDEDKQDFLMQIGGSVDIESLLSMYAQITGASIEQLVQELESFSEAEREAALQQISQDVQNFQAQGNEQPMQYGGIPYNENGYYELDPLEDPYAMIPTPDGLITTQNLDYPINAYDGYSGEFLDTMLPGQDYQFDTDLVLEEPIYSQTGGDIERLRREANAKLESAKKETNPQRKKLKEYQAQQINNLVNEYSSFISTANVRSRNQGGLLNDIRFAVGPSNYNQAEFEDRNRRFINAISQANNAYNVISDESLSTQDIRNKLNVRGTPQSNIFNAIGEGLGLLPTRIASSINYGLTGQEQPMGGVYYTDDTSAPVAQIEPIPVTRPSVKPQSPSDSSQDVNYQGRQLRPMGNNEFFDPQGNVWTKKGNEYVVTEPVSGPSGSIVAPKKFTSSSKKAAGSTPSTTYSSLLARMQDPSFTDFETAKKDINNSNLPVEQKAALLDYANSPTASSIGEGRLANLDLEELESITPGERGVSFTTPSTLSISKSKKEAEDAKKEKLNLPKIKGRNVLASLNAGSNLFTNTLANSRFARAFAPTAPIFRQQARYNYTDQPLIDFEPIANSIMGQVNDISRNINTNSTTGLSVLSSLQGNALNSLTKAANDIVTQNNQISRQNSLNRLNAANQQFTQQQQYDAAAYDQQLRRSAARDAGIDMATNDMIGLQEAANTRRTMLDLIPLQNPILEDVSNPLERLLGRRSFGQNPNYNFSFNRQTQTV